MCIRDRYMRNDIELTYLSNELDATVQNKKSDKINDNEYKLTQRPGIIGVFCKLTTLFVFNL